MEKRRVFARIDTSESITSNSSSDGARKGNSGSPSFGVTARARVNIAGSSNVKVAGSSTPTSSASAGARVVHGTPSFSSSSPGGVSVASGGGGIKARVLGYNNINGHQDGSPLSNSNVRTPPTSTATISASPNFINNNSTRSFRGGSTEPTDSPTASVYARKVNAASSTAFPSSASARQHQPSPITATANPGFKRPARAADPLKASITSRPHAAAQHALLPAATLSCSPSSSAAVFGASTSARTPGSMQTVQRPSSPIRRPASPVRPASPLRVQTSPARSTTPHPPPSPIRRTHSTMLPQQSPSSSLALKRPSTSSQSSSSTASTSMSLSPEIFSDSAKTVTKTAYHRTRRRSQSLSSSTSSISNVSVCEAAKRESREIKASVPLHDLLATPPQRAPTLEEKLQRDAKVNRKILDLEITNTSLLAINSTLERTKVKQAQEIRLLRRRMRDQSILPQHLGAGGSMPPLLSPISDDFSWSSGGLEDEEQEELEWEEVLRRDTHFADVVSKLESLNRRAKEAIEKPINMGGKVLNPFFPLEAESPSAARHSHSGDHTRAVSSSTTENDEDESKDGDETSTSISIDMSTDLSNSTRSSSAATSSPEISISHISSLSSID